MPSIDHHSAKPWARGRGSTVNPENRFERLGVVLDPGEEPTAVATQYFRDASRSILVETDSPDLGIHRTLNPYRGCLHGCCYCYARPNHEQLGLSAGLDFESKIFVKEAAPELLRAELMRPSYQPRSISFSGVTDAYQPIERDLRLTRRCLEVLAEFRHPASVVTKSALVARDADVLGDLARDHAASAMLSITTLDTDLQRRLEPRASTPRARLQAIETLAAAGVPVAVNVAPVIPGLTDHEMPAILRAAADHGARCAGWILVRLPHAVKDLVTSWLATHEPLKTDKVLGQLRQLHGGQLYSATFGTRMRGQGPLADHLAGMFALYCRRHGLSTEFPDLNTAAFRRPGAQLELF